MPDLEPAAKRLEDEVDDVLNQILEDESAPPETWNAAKAIMKGRLQERLGAALKDFRTGTVRLLGLADGIAAAVQGLGTNTGESATQLRKLQGDLAELHRQFHDQEGMRASHGSPAEANAVVDDEKRLPVPGPAEIAEGDRNVAGPIASGTVLRAPTPSASRSFDQLADEYVRFFAGADFASPQAKEQVAALAAKAKAFRPRYEAVGAGLGVPWWFIAGVHMLESSFNFATHLHNGDPLTARTTRVPAGQPASGAPPFTWEASATDALRRQGLDQVKDWSLARALFRWEQYNGFGYRSRGVPTPYLWSLSTIYAKGKYVADGVFDPNAVSQQCGAATLLRHLQLAGDVALNVDFVGEAEAKLAPQFEKDKAAAGATPPAPPTPPPASPPPAGTPTVPPVVAAATPFEAFLRERLPGLQHFKPAEFLVQGGADPTLGLNTPPPQELWPNVVDLVRVLDEFRRRIGQPVMLNSVYRSEAYNKAVGGVTGSQHKLFRAADIQVTGGGGTPEQWAALLKTMRAEKVFQGGIGIYSNFVHVDTRGWNADWQG